MERRTQMRKIDNCISLILFIIIIVLVPVFQFSAKIDKTSLPKFDRSSGRASTVLFWTKFAGSLGLAHYKNVSTLFENCSIRNCLGTLDRSVVAQSAAVLFDMSEFRTDEIPDQTSRALDQYFVFTHFESVGNPTFTPSRSKWKDLDAKTGGFFNLTMTYRLDSDIFTDSYTSLFEERETEPVKVTLQSKPNGTLWLVSHCKTSSKREDYAAQLFKHITVDKIGRCSGQGAKNHCPPNGCSRDFLSSYKFHLAFENSVCKDYITEKAYKPLNYDSIPIVLGGADYSLFMPPYSYINVEDFENPVALGNYLQKLSENATEYEKYFAWRFAKEPWTPAKKKLIPDHDHSWWCELCRLLNLPAEEKPKKIYDDIYEWWFQPDQCRKLKFGEKG